MTEIDTNCWKELASYIDKSDIILLSTHINGDGDGIGSEVAFYYYLKDLGKQCRIINPSPISENLQVIDPDSVVESYSDNMNNWLQNVELTIVFDIGDYRRAGQIGDLVYENSTVVSLDHHPMRENHPFTLNIVDPNAPATTFMIWKFFEYLGIYIEKIPLYIANPLYAGLVTDTGSFKYQSTTFETHLMASHLLRSGVRGYNIQREIYENNKLSRIKLLGLAIHGLKYSSNYKVVWVVVTNKMIEDVGGSYEDVGGIAEFIRGIKNVEISFIIQEASNSNYRISFRSSGNYSINDIAESYDGGGHKYAAGATICDMSLKAIEKDVICKLSDKIKGEFSGY